MEFGGLVSEGSWSCFDSEVMTHLCDSHHFAEEQDQGLSMVTPAMLCSDHSSHSYSSYWPQYNSSSFLPLADYGGYSICTGEEQITAPSFPGDQFNLEVGGLFAKPPFPLLPCDHNAEATKKRVTTSELEMPEMTGSGDGHTVNPNKKARAAASVPKKRKNPQPKKAQRTVATANEEEGNGELNSQSSSCYSSEEDCNGSQELLGSGITSSSSKTTAGRGSSTEPQSLYARKRRERITERLRTLQSLVPNGTKVDLSTMLEEAVEYVKFLHLQIKLLSSDDLWMYAPIAYNGMSVGFDLNISP
ncbi:unnamed protein product [Musa acuminata subsp. burmannicoides]